MVCWSSVLQEMVVGASPWCCRSEFGDVLLMARLAFLLPVVVHNSHLLLCSLCVFFCVLCSVDVLYCVALWCLFLLLLMI